MWFYPACGNEILEFDGAARFDEVLAVDREPSGFDGPAGFAPNVADPGPGDDVGTLVVWDDGVARRASDSGRLDVWLVLDEIPALWVC